MTTYLFRRSQWPSILISGPDHRDFLHRLTTKNFKGSGIEPLWGAFLKPSGALVSKFLAISEGDKTRLLVEPKSKEVLPQLLDFYHFGENLTWLVEDTPECLEVRQMDFPLTKSPKGNHLTLPSWKDTNGTLAFGGNTPEGINLSEQQYLDLEAYHLIPQDQVHLLEPYNLVASPHAERLIDINKGCYPGQEVVERLLSRGLSPYRMVKLRGKASLGQLIQAEKPCGKVISRHEFPEPFSMALVSRAFDPNTPVHSEAHQLLEVFN